MSSLNGVLAIKSAMVLAIKRRFGEMKNMLTVFHLSTPFNFIIRNDAFQELCKLLLCHEEVSMAYVDPIFYGAIDAVGPFDKVNVLIVAALLEEMRKECFYSGCSMHPEAFTSAVFAFQLQQFT